MNINEFTVTEEAMRPASDKRECFYCRQPIGAKHKDCVLVNRKVKVELTIQYEISVPAHWDEYMVNFHRNDSSWCAGNLVQELEELDKEKGCLCNAADIEFKYLGESNEGPFLEERP